MSQNAPGQPLRLGPFRLNTTRPPDPFDSGTIASPGTVTWDWQTWQDDNWTGRPFLSGITGSEVTPIIGTRRLWLYNARNFLNDDDAMAYPDDTFIFGASTGFIFPNRSPKRLAYGRQGFPVSKTLRYVHALLPQGTNVEPLDRFSDNLEFFDDRGIFFFSGGEPLGFDSAVATANVILPPQTFTTNFASFPRALGSEAITFVISGVFNPLTDYANYIPLSWAAHEALFDRHLFVIFDIAGSGFNLGPIQNKVVIPVSAPPVEITPNVPESTWLPYVEDFFA
jgi:hypothetical protein